MSSSIILARVARIRIRCISSSSSTSLLQRRGFNTDNRSEVLKVLDINKFDDDEINRSFNRLLTNTTTSTTLSPTTTTTPTTTTPTNVLSIKAIEDNLRYEFLRRQDDSCTRYSEKDINIIVKQLDGSILMKKNGDSISINEYKKRIRQYGDRLDNRLIALGGSLLLSGSSIGIIVPCMPMLVQSLNISPSEFGYVVSAFGVSKLLGNIPSSYYVNIYGRKPIMIGGLLFCSIGLGGLSLALTPIGGFPLMIACRFVTGLGVSCFMTGAMMYMTDISTSLNRTRSIAPVMSAFQLGIACGPAIGGIMIDSFGIPLTYVLCGTLFLGITGLNHAYLNETLLSTEAQKRRALEPLSIGFKKSFQEASKSWRQLLKIGQVSDPVILNMAYWFALSGVQMTMLPLLMVSPTFSLTASQIGQSFALMSVCSVIASQPLAMVADKVGKVSSMLGGCSLIASSIFILPYATTYPELLCTLVPLSIGSTILQSVPTSLLADLASSSEERAQGQSLLRTAGDVGLVGGAIFSGSLLQLTSIETAVNTNGALLASAMAFFSVRHLMRNRIK